LRDAFVAQWVFVARDQLSRRLSIMVVEDGARGGAEGVCLGVLGSRRESCFQELVVL
jgi:hypothetical protein